MFSILQHCFECLCHKNLGFSVENAVSSASFLEFGVSGLVSRMQDLGYRVQIQGVGIRPYCRIERDPQCFLNKSCDYESNRVLSLMSDS